MNTVKKFKLITFFVLLCFSNIINAQEVNLDNLIAGATDGYSISELENILETNKVEKLKEWMQDNKYTFISENDTFKYLEYNKGIITIYVYYKSDAINEVRAVSSPRDYYYANKFKDGGYTKKGMETKIIDSTKEEYELTTYQKGSYIYLTFDYPVYAISVYKN